MQLPFMGQTVSAIRIRLFFVFLSDFFFLLNILLTYNWRPYASLSKRGDLFFFLLWIFLAQTLACLCCFNAFSRRLMFKLIIYRCLGIQPHSGRNLNTVGTNNIFNLMFPCVNMCNCIRLCQSLSEDVRCLTIMNLRRYESAHSELTRLRRAS